MMPTISDHKLPVAMAEQIPFAFTNTNINWAFPLACSQGASTATKAMPKRGDSNPNAFSGKVKMEGYDPRRRRQDSVSFKDVVSFWETFQCLGGADGASSGKGVGPLSEAATFEQILANWEFRGRAGTNATLEDVVNYAAQRWQKQYSRRRKKTHKKARSSVAPYPMSKTLREKMRKKCRDRKNLRKSCREKQNRLKVNEKFDALCALVNPDATGKMEKSSVLSEAMRIIAQLRDENSRLERERHDLQLQCQSVSRCLSAGLSQISRHRQAAVAAAAAAATRQRNLQGRQHDSKTFPIPPPPVCPPPPPIGLVQPPKIAAQNQVPRLRSRNDSLQELLVQQRKNILVQQRKNSWESKYQRPNQLPNLTNFITTDEEEDKPSPMDDIDFTFKPIFDDVLSSLPRMEQSSNGLIRPSLAREMSSDR
eukprot:CAMPEP_0114507424 /NCGR_PEP_ID=MMETSP0109-20121206/12004_1 /TAXON_ID=29199 /ORGANISM="Chlorarachnion reptans, Strain CCCM449" /LENGTH=423 /DNA_ID=CAMNT_0001686179 /DNA_START=321 /DNA_END=1592 /DNA_ORIENTATION=+